MCYDYGHGPCPAWPEGETATTCPDDHCRGSSFGSFGIYCAEFLSNARSCGGDYRGLPCSCRAGTCMPLGNPAQCIQLLLDQVMTVVITTTYLDGGVGTTETLGGPDSEQGRALALLACWADHCADACLAPWPPDAYGADRLPICQTCTCTYCSPQTRACTARAAWDEPLAYGDPTVHGGCAP